MDQTGTPMRDWRRGLYAVTPECADDAALLAFAGAVLGGGAVLLQYRGKEDDPAARLRRALALQSLCARHRVALVINDDVELAATVGAAGVHLGRDDAPPAAARERLGPDAIIGVSCYDQLERARRAAAAGASYLAFGAVHPSPTKPLARRAGAELLRQGSALRLPVVAIGGVRLENAPPLIAAGADLLAVISDLAGHPDTAARAAAYAALFAAPTRPGPSFA